MALKKLKPLSLTERLAQGEEYRIRLTERLMQIDEREEINDRILRDVKFLNNFQKFISNMIFNLYEIHQKNYSYKRREQMIEPSIDADGLIEKFKELTRKYFPS